LNSMILLLETFIKKNIRLKIFVGPKIFGLREIG
jgi:hypothetical protein